MAPTTGTVTDHIDHQHKSFSKQPASISYPIDISLDGKIYEDDGARLRYIRHNSENETTSRIDTINPL